MQRIPTPALSLAAAVAVAIGGFAVLPHGSSTHAAARPAAQVSPEENEVGGPQDPADYLTNKFTSGKAVSQAEIRRAMQQAKALPSSSGTWSLIGPTNIGGRVTDVVPDPHHSNTLFVGAAGGGVWKSNDAGATFKSVWPTSYPQTIGALAMSADGTLWAGTGEANPPGGGLTFFGDGVYRSSDGGRSWQAAGLKDSGAIGRIVADPTDPQRVFVAATGNLFGSSTDRGVYRLTKAGGWQRVLATANNTTGAIDLAIDPKNPQHVFASLWDHQRNRGARVYGGTGSGLFRSLNGGNSWSRVENVQGTASTDVAGTGLRSSETLGRIGVAISSSNPNRVYVISGTQYGDDKGFYVSNDGGNSFVPGGQAGGGSGFEWWFGRMFVDPKDPDHLFNTDIRLRESHDGGATWVVSSGPHADQHAMAWDPHQKANPTRVYLGNDGGVYRSESDGATNTWVKSQYQPYNQSYHIAVAADDNRRIATGLQDNGSVRTWTETQTPRDLTQFNAYGGGDGHMVIIDPTNHNIYYECSQNGYCTRHEDVDGVQVKTPFGTRHSTRVTADAPVALDPTDHNVVYFGGNVLDRSTDGGKTFTAISPPGDYLTGPVPPQYDDKGLFSNAYGTITAIAPSKADPETIYVGTDSGRLWKTTDLGATWTQMAPSVLPDRWVNAIVIDPSNPNHVFVAYSGYRDGDTSASVWQTRTAGATWNNASGKLPNAPVEMLAYDWRGRVLYAATDLGVFYTRDAKPNWKRVGNGLPATPVLDVKLSGDGQTIFAGTFGRSIWQTLAPKS